MLDLKRSKRLSDRVRVCPDESFNPEFRRILDSAGVKDATFHDLRRTCITEWLESGLKPHEVMALAGHSDVDTTMKYYVNTRSDLLDKARQASSEILNKKACCQIQPIWQHAKVNPEIQEQVLNLYHNLSYLIGATVLRLNLYSTLF